MLELWIGRVSDKCLVLFCFPKKFEISCCALVSSWQCSGYVSISLRSKIWICQVALALLKRAREADSVPIVALREVNDAEHRQPAFFLQPAPADLCCQRKTFAQVLRWGKMTRKGLKSTQEKNVLYLPYVGSGSHELDGPKKNRVLILRNWGLARFSANILFQL